MRLFRGTRCSVEVLMGLFRKSDGAETAGERAPRWSVPGTQAARTRARGSLVRSLTRVRPSNMPPGSPKPAARDGRRRTPGESLSPKRCPASRMGPVSDVTTRYGSRPTFPGWRGWVKTIPLSGLEAQAWPSLEENPRLEPKWTTEDAHCLRDPGRIRERVMFSELVLSDVLRDVHTRHRARSTVNGHDARMEKLRWRVGGDSSPQHFTKPKRV